MLSTRASGRVVQLVCRTCTSAFSTSPNLNEQKSYKLVVIGGGTGGMATAHRFAKKVGKGNLAVIEPNDFHYYQPMWTLVGAGVKTFGETQRPMGSLFPQGVDWIKDRLGTIDPEKCIVTTANGTEIKYEYLVVAMGLQLNYDKIKGLPEAFDIDPTIVSNYSTKTVLKTFPALRDFKEGNAIFTFPNTPIKCAGAPQKIMHLADQYLRKHHRRDKANIMYNSSLGVIFGVKKYATALEKLAKERDISVNYKRNLIEVRPHTKEAVFEIIGSETGETITENYSFLHVVPPMSAPDSLQNCLELVDKTGFLEVDKESLQHVRYHNVFGIGDCTTVPTSKTAAAVAAQSGVLGRNLWAFMNNKPVRREYDGYTSCPLVTSYGKCILAEFDFNGNPIETFPFDQGVERRSMWHLKVDVMPLLYWHGLIKGLWPGPKVARKVLNLGKV